jgi:hypothetical protein
VIFFTFIPEGLTEEEKQMVRDELIAFSELPDPIQPLTSDGDGDDEARALDLYIMQCVFGDPSVLH